VYPPDHADQGEHSHRRQRQCDENVGDIAEGPRWREVDGLGVVERVIDLVAIEEGVDQPAAGFWLHG
jgi:hypothetical protein